MASVSTYLNLPGNTEAALEFYRSVLGTRYQGDGIMRMGNAPQTPGQAPISEAGRKLVTHVSRPILVGHLLMGTDATQSMFSVQWMFDCPSWR